MRPSGAALFLPSFPDWRLPLSRHCDVCQAAKVSHKQKSKTFEFEFERFQGAKVCKWVRRGRGVAPPMRSSNFAIDIDGLGLWARERWKLNLAGDDLFHLAFNMEIPGGLEDREFGAVVGFKEELAAELAHDLD